MGAALDPAPLLAGHRLTVDNGHRIGAAGVVRFCRQPRGDGDLHVITNAAPGVVAVAALPDVRLDLAGVLG